MNMLFTRLPVRLILGLLLSTLSLSINLGGQSAGSQKSPTVGLHLGLSQAYAWGTGQNLGDCEEDCPPREGVSPPTAEGEPIDAATGNLFLVESDYIGASATGLSFTRFHNSNADSNSNTIDKDLGLVWNSEWDRQVRYMGIVPPQPGRGQAYVRRMDGRNYIFKPTNSSGAFAGDPDVMEAFRLLLDSGNNIIGAQFITDDDSIETYQPTSPISPSGTNVSVPLYLTKITTRNGLQTTITRSSGLATQVRGPFGHTLDFTYKGGLLNTMTTPDGGVYTYTFDDKQQLIKVTYPDGSLRQYLYEAPSTTSYGITGIIDELGNRYATFGYSSKKATSSQHAGGSDKTTLSYNSDGTTRVTDPRGYTHTYTFTTPFTKIKPATVSGAPTPRTLGKAFTYDANGYVASRTDWNSNITTYIHDAHGNETSRTEAAGTPMARTTTTAWHPSYHLPAKITEPNRMMAFAYDARGNLLSKTLTANGLTRRFSYTYNAMSQILTETDPRGNVTRFTYDGKGNLTSFTNAMGHKTSFTQFDLSGRWLKRIDPNGIVTTLTYDGRGRLTSRMEHKLKTSYQYDKAGNLIKVIFPDNSWWAMSYDMAHRLIGVQNTLGVRIAITYDAASNIIMAKAFDATNVLKLKRSYAYDSVNRLIRSIGAQGQTTTISYDDQGNLAAVSDPLGHQTTYSYDALNRLVKTINPNGGTTAYAYDGNDHLISILDPRGLKTVYSWNGLDDLLSVTSPDAGTITNTYDPAGNALTTTDGRGRQTTYAYDKLNRRTRASFSDGKSVVWQYDLGTFGKGRLAKFTDATGSTSYSYDANGHIVKDQRVIGTLTSVTSYAYDTQGRPSSITYPSGTAVRYTYNAAGAVTDIHDGNGEAIISGVTYSSVGDVLGWKFGSGATYARRLDLNGRIAGLTMPSGNNIALTYDTAGRITKITDTKIPTKTFAYDALNRLVGYVGGPLTQSYSYDANGNRLNLSLKDGAISTNLKYAYAASSNRLSKISGSGSENFIYDAAGNTTKHTTPLGNIIYMMDARNHLEKATIGSVTKRYGSSGIGQRVHKSNPADAKDMTVFAYDKKGHLIGEYDAEGDLIQETIWLGDLPVATLRPEGIFYISPDHLGAPHQITNPSKQVVWLWDHDPFGNGEPTGSIDYNLRFPGQYRDAETGLHYNYFRDYDPELGRYIQSDPIGLIGGINTYAYSEGNPVSWVDPFGLAPVPWFELVKDLIRDASIQIWKDAGLTQVDQSLKELEKKRDEALAEYQTCKIPKKINDALYVKKKRQEEVEKARDQRRWISGLSIVAGGPIGGTIDLSGQIISDSKDGQALPKWVDQTSNQYVGGAKQAYINLMNLQQ